MTDTLLSYEPTEVSPPGDTLAELIAERGITQTELAKRMGRPLNAINEMVLGTKELTEDTALELERVLGTPAHFWLARESRYREFKARQRDAGQAEDRMDWLERFPIKALQEAGRLPKGRITRAYKLMHADTLLRFFGVASPQGWVKQYEQFEGAFRRANPSKQTDTAAITAWLRMGELQAERLDCAAYDAAKLVERLAAMRALSTRPAPEIGKGLVKLCAEAGVALTWVQALPGTHVSGVARWRADRPLIQMSLLGKWNDVFWFSFFHEVAHVLKHPKRAVFLDDASSGGKRHSKEELEADQFAADLLIPPAQRARVYATPLTVPAIKSCAQSLGIHPGIVVGHLQHMGHVSYGHPLAKLKERYTIG